MSPQSLDEQSAAHVAELFRALSDASRVRIFSLIINQEMNVSQLAEKIGVTESAISHHMRGLRQLRLVKSRRDGKEVYYIIDDPHIIELFHQGVRHIQET